MQRREGDDLVGADRAGQDEPLDSQHAAGAVHHRAGGHGGQLEQQEQNAAAGGAGEPAPVHRRHHVDRAGDGARCRVSSPRV